jgi:monoamine oxidase
MTITRRAALKLSITAFLGGLATRSRAQDMAGTKVIVIGAGFAGLAAAKQVQEQGADAIIFEAGSYIGGRVRTDRSLGAPFELGAGWIHGPSRQNPTQRLANLVNARTYVTDDDNFDVFDPQGNALSDAQYERLDELYEYLEEILFYPVRSGQQSVEEVLTRIDPDIVNDPLGRWMLSAYFEFSIGAGIGDISAANGFESSSFDGADVILTEGYDSIIAPLAAGLDIRLNTSVSKIWYDDDGVEVDGEPADYVVCTVPLGVLKSGKITFDPPLPRELRDAISEIGFGSVTKIAIKFPEPFWDTGTQYFGMMTEPKGRWNYWLNYRTFSDENILLGLSVGDYAPFADRMSKAAMTEDALDVLRSVWGDKVGVPTAVLTTHWSQDPHFLGAYSYPQAGGLIAQFRAFEKPVSNRVLFAGEHTEFDHLGTTHGALLSGRRAADAILKF